MSETAATFSRINALVDNASSKIRDVLVQMPGSQLASKSSSNYAPRIVQKKAEKPSFYSKKKAAKAVCAVSEDVRVSPTRKACPATSSGSQISALIEKHQGNMGEARLYRSLSKKHLLLVHTVDLEEPMGDEEARKMEKSLQTHSETSVKDCSQKQNRKTSGGEGCCRRL